MYRKGLLTLLFITSLILAGGIAVSAQTFIVRGRVELRDTNGNLAPVQGAVVEGFRVDTNGKTQPATTNKRGEFSIAGLQAGGLYMLVASASGAAPKAINNVRSNRAGEEFNFALEAGDGKRYTQEEAMQMAKSNAAPVGASPVSGGETADQKKAREDYEKKKKEVDEKNARIQGADKIIAAAQKDGYEAFKAKNYDLALAKYDEGIKADPDYIQSVIMFKNLKSEALRARGFDKHVNWVKNKEAALREGSKADIQAAYDEAKTNLVNIEKAPTSTDPKETEFLQRNKYNALANMASALYMLSVNEIDMGKAEEIKSVYPQFLAVETDPVKKDTEQREFGDALRKSGDCDSAVVEYQKILATKPDDPDSLAGTGLCIVNIGFVTDNKDKLQEGLNVLQHFVEVAPETHKYKADVKSTIEYLKTEQKLAPQKGGKTPVKKKP